MPDAESVLHALTRVLPEFLSMGATVELGDFDRLMVNVGSYGSGAEEDFSKDLIKSNKISYQPSTRVKKVMKGVDYKKVG